jgi:hypothetical protein
LRPLKIDAIVYNDREERHILVDRFYRKEDNVEDHFITAIKQAIQDRYQHKYGRVTIDLDRIVTEQDQQARVEFTIRKANSFITRYYGTATLEKGQVHLDVMSI